MPALPTAADRAFSCVLRINGVERALWWALVTNAFSATCGLVLREFGREEGRELHRQRRGAARAPPGAQSQAVPDRAGDREPVDPAMRPEAMVLRRHHGVAQRGADVLQRHPRKTATLEIDALAVEKLAIAVVKPGLTGLPVGAHVGIGGHRGRAREKMRGTKRLSETPFCAPVSLLDTFASSPMVIERYTKLDQEFHVQIILPSGNDRLLEIYRAIGGPLQMARLYSKFDAAVYTNYTEPENDAIMQAIDKRDCEGLKNALTEHVEQAKTRVLKLIEINNLNGKS